MKSSFLSVYTISNIDGKKRLLFVDRGNYPYLMDIPLTSVQYKLLVVAGFHFSDLL
jgi:hypothetical protein